MRITPYNLNKIENVTGYYKKSELLKILEEFTESDMESAKIEDYSHKSASSCVASFGNAIRRYKMNGIKALTRNGEVFLIKTSALKN